MGAKVGERINRGFLGLGSDIILFYQKSMCIAIAAPFNALQ
jgi:hypothetical protein